MSTGTSGGANAPQVSSALRIGGYRAHFFTYLFAMMADNIEHVISYWVCFQKFHSPALGGFAVLSHWLPFLFFSVAVGALNDRFDSRRLIQAGMALFITASLGWGYFFVTDTLQMWHAMLLLTIHGCAGVLWQTSSQMLLYDIVGPENLPSAVRLNSTARYLGVLVGPAVGGAIMYGLGPTRGIFVDTIFYLPLLLWLVRAPYGRRFRKDAEPPKRAVKGLADIALTIAEVRTIPVLGIMIVLAGAISFFVGNSYQAQMPGFADDLGTRNAGASYSMLLAADAAGALVAGFLLEARGSGLLKTSPASAAKLAIAWGLALCGFALVRSYPLALACLFTAGFFELSTSSMNQTIVQMNAPGPIRGRVLGLFNMAALGLRAFSGITVGLVGSVTSIHFSLALSAGIFVLVTGFLLTRLRAKESASVPVLPPRS